MGKTELADQEEDAERFVSPQSTPDRVPEAVEQPPPGIGARTRAQQKRRERGVKRLGGAKRPSSAKRSSSAKRPGSAERSNSAKRTNSAERPSSSDCQDRAEYRVGAEPTPRRQVIVEGRRLARSSTRSSFLSVDAAEPSWDPSGINGDLVFHKDSTPALVINNSEGSENRSRPATPDRITLVDRPVVDRQPTPKRQVSGIIPLGRPSLSLPSSPTRAELISGNNNQADKALAGQLTASLVAMAARGEPSKDDGGGETEDGDGISDSEGVVEKDSPAGWVLEAGDLVNLSVLEFSGVDIDQMTASYLTVLTAQLDMRKSQLMAVFPKLSRVPDTADLKKEVQATLRGVVGRLREVQRKLVEINARPEPNVSTGSTGSVAQPTGPSGHASPPAGAANDSAAHPGEAEMTDAGSRVTSRSSTISPTPSTANSRLSEATLDFKRMKVNSQEPRIETDISDLIAEMKLLLSKHPASDKEARDFTDRVSNIVRRVGSLNKDATELCKDALDAEMCQKASDLDDGASRLRTTLRDLEYKSEQLKSSRGLTGLTDMKSGDLTPPTFGGHPGEDVYDFLETLEQFVDSRSYSNAQVLRMVKLTCLKGQVQRTCKYMNTFDEVKGHLVDAYGQPRVMFDAKLKEFGRVGKCPAAPAAKARDWYLDVLQQLKELQRIAKKYQLVDELRHSTVMTVIHTSLPSKVEADFLDKLAEQGISCLDKTAVFNETMYYLEELVAKTTEKVNYHLMLGVKDVERTFERQGQKKTYTVDIVPLDEPSPPSSPEPARRKAKPPKPPNAQQPTVHVAASKPKRVSCVGCGGTHTFHFECELFKAATVKERYPMSKTQGSCMRCLRMDAGLDLTDRRAWFQSHEPHCSEEWVCKAGWCKGATPRQQQHLTMCGNHYKQNKSKLEDFVNAQDSSVVPPSTRYFFSNYQMCPASEGQPRSHPADAGEYEIVRGSKHAAIYLLQDVYNVQGEKLTLFFDTGCSGAAISTKAATVLGTVNIRPGPTKLGVAGGGTLTIDGGVDSFLIELFKPKTKAELEGLVMDEVTSPLDLHLLSDAYSELCDAYEEEYGDLDGLPTVPESIGGGRVDVMVGILYPHLFPEKVFSLNCGLEIYRTPIKTLSGHHGVLGGPHSSWVRANKKAGFMNPTAFLTAEMRAYRAQCNALYFHSLPDGPVARELEEEEQADEWQCSGHHCDPHADDGGWSIPEHWVLAHSMHPTWEERLGFEGADRAGAEVAYRCMRCRNCADCRKGEMVEAVSLQEEVEQALIEKNVWLDENLNVLRCKLPFLKEPATYLTGNYPSAERIFESQMRSITKNPALKEAVIKAHDKLLLKGHVCAVTDLSEEEKVIFDATKGSYTIPWSCVTKLESISTPYRMVFNASHKLRTGESLNSILAKGANRLPQIFSLLVKFSSRRYAFTADVSMAYNSVKLEPEYFRFQQYLWKRDLDPLAQVTPMVIKTLIYGVKPSGNLTQAGFAKAAEKAHIVRPDLADGAHVILENTYVDDTVSSCSTIEQCRYTAECMKEVLAMANVTIKDFTFSGQAPSEKVSANGETVGVLGYLWNPVSEMISLASKPVVLGNSRRGRKPVEVQGEVKAALASKFTKRILTGQLAGIFDPKGMLTPITAQFKLQLAKVVELRTGWDDPLPLELLDPWASMIREIQLLQGIYYPRCFVHPDAVSEQVELVISVDASQYVAIAAAHARSQLPDGTFACRLIAGKSKLTKLATIPRGELKAAVMGASVAHSIKAALGDQVTRTIYVTDSTIVLYWLHQDARPLQTAVRNGVIEVRRLTSLEDWYHIPTDANVADIGTRGVTIGDVALGSDWANGKQWMKEDLSSAPLRTVSEVQLDQEELRAALKEVRATESMSYNIPKVTDKLESRYSFSQYVVDPCILAWHKAIRVLAFVLQFIGALKAAVSRSQKSKADPPRCKEQPVRRTQPDRKCKSKPVAKNYLEDEAVYKVSFKCRQDVKDFRLGAEHLEQAEHYFFKKATAEVRQFAKPSDYIHCTKEKDGVLTYIGRILDNQEIEDLDNILGEVTPLFFTRPVVERHSPVAYSVMSYVHTHLVNHKNPVVTLRESRSICFVLHGRDLANEIAEACVTCRREKARKVQQEFGKQHPASLSVTPAFYRAQVDMAGPWWATCEHACRSSVKVWAVVFRDPATCATAVYAMQASTSSAFIQAYTRHSFRYGHPMKLYIDAGSQLIKACREATFGWQDLHSSITGRFNVGIDYEVCPPHAHYFHGAVERSILEVKRVLDAVFTGFKMSLFAYETAFNFCANQINDMPICVGSRTDHLGNRDLLTPNRLLLGRNNRRAPVSCTLVDSGSSIISQMEDLQKAWWQVWSSERLSDFVPAPAKWKRSGKPVKIGHIVLFPIQKSDGSFAQPTWKTGRVEAVTNSHDGEVRRVVIVYRNDQEDFDRQVERGVRELAVLHDPADFELAEQLAVAARHAKSSGFEVSSEKSVADHIQFMPWDPACACLSWE